MRFRSLGGEALRNLRSGTSRAGLLALVVVLLSVALISFDLLSIQSLQSRARDARQQAGAIRVLVSKGAVNPTACSDLARLNAVDNAGAIWELGSIKMSALPRVEVPLFAVSPGVASMLEFPDIRSGGVYIPEELSERWQATRGSVLESLSGPLVVHGVYKYSEQDGRDPRLANAVVVVRDSNQKASECWFSVWPPSKTPDQYVLGVVASGGNDEASLQIAPLNPTVGQQFDFAREYTNRVTAISAPAVVAVFGLVALSGMMRRRMETAGSLHAGARYRNRPFRILLVGVRRGRSNLCYKSPTISHPSRRTGGGL
ncbi:hypothetical protein SAMN04488591_3587 [Microbacterium azadirachtae]|uniref:MacB-like periplasmic core domain-containing protein n=1 Tax=Microbacterium azadirachtae TaxID=582680 RepID=A0A1I6JHG1_9MICO|nr:hypothetical protein SAMN04488591_3587 [Microbacterium azadirachtae]